MILSSFILSLMATSSVVEAARSQCWRDSPCDGPKEPSFPGVWEKNNFSPDARFVNPVRVLKRDHSLQAEWPSKQLLKGDDSMLIFDFGKEVGGVVSLEYTAKGKGKLGISYSESRNFTGYVSDESNGGSGPDGALFQSIDVGPNSKTLSYLTPEKLQRGGFRYMTLFTSDAGDDFQLDISNVELEISFQPTWPNLRAYRGYFHSSDELINRIWYAGAYTCQVTTIPVNTARPFPLLNTGWRNDAWGGTHLTPAIIVDGAKRDRAVWSGDLGVATRSTLVSTGDFQSVKGSLDVQFSNQHASGELPMVGPPINFAASDTYTLSTLIGVYDYVVYSGDTAYLTSIWDPYKRAVRFVTDKIDKTGQLYVDGDQSWGRTASSRGYTTDGNALLYRTLVVGAVMAEWQGDSNQQTEWTTLAGKIKTLLNEKNYDASKGAFKNKADDARVYSEDGNSMALYYLAASGTSTISKTSDFLVSQWGPRGAVTQELPGNVVPYIESFEVKAHLAARRPQRALDLMRLSWGWYLDHPDGTGSTCIEGYHTDGSWRYRDANYNKGGSYTSHAHGWSTGPTDALSSHVVGLQPTGPGGKEWLLEPQFGDLQFAEAGFTTNLGKFSARWDRHGGGYVVRVKTPTETKGKAVLPFSGDNKPQSVTVNGRKVTFDTDDKLKAVTFDLKGGVVSIAVFP